MRCIVAQTTHQRLLVDALDRVDTPAGKRLAKMMLRHHRQLFRGSRDPDRLFRDYQNHVVHVTDGFWGGAPRLAHRWYERMVQSIRDRRYRSAAHAAGVMSHYIVDPMHPLHTAQCDRARIMHLPTEYIASVFYDRFIDRLGRSGNQIEIVLSDSPSWLGELVLHGAARSHRHYVTLIHDLDLDRLSSDPSTSFGSRFEAANAEMMGIAITALSSVFDRAGETIERDQGRRIARPSMTATTSTAWLAAPFRLAARYFSHRRLHARVTRLIQTHRDGDLTNPHLPSEVDVIARVIEIHQTEQRWRRRIRADSSSRDDRPMIAGRVGLFDIEPQQSDPSSDSQDAVSQGAVSHRIDQQRRAA